MYRQWSRFKSLALSP
ncbi:hypothetical protein F383_27158 [Gossypium arboreum]|uniref:Uncharacterized protein n=1 Tax=Gossypium arboreum TaxID=29729 RepID=A0A0B0P9U1_GOSAR|nr:hypothetical protein F383_27158 [Gossypium arboreum]